MHNTLYEHITSSINEAATFVTRHMPINITPERAYEGLLNDQAMTQAFKHAVKYLTGAPLHKRIAIAVDDMTININLRFPSTEEYPMYLMPATTSIIRVTHESELGTSVGDTHQSGERVADAASGV